LEASSAPFAALTPDVVQDALDAAGFRCDGRLLPLASYENRVYQVGQEAGPPVIAKFYRPGRWSLPQILEEHAFADELRAQEIPVVAPLPVASGGTLGVHAGFCFAVYRRQGGRPPELHDRDVLEQLGRTLGRLHAVGAVRAFSARPALTVASHGEAPVAWIAASGLLPPELAPAWREIAARALDAIHTAFAQGAPLQHLRLHGDCHAGNVLWTDAGPYFVDFDDARHGPAVQDLWMLLSGDANERRAHLSLLLSGYGEFADFDPRQTQLIEALRTLRILHYAAWLGQRWHDPAFPKGFPWFNTQRYWQEQILQLREQVAAMQER
jgi:Ser/Thr protein kinase RdoA (MazF antagonist)